MIGRFLSLLELLADLGRLDDDDTPETDGLIGIRVTGSGNSENNKRGAC